jgi:hypothetical protein
MPSAKSEPAADALISLLGTKRIRHAITRQFIGILLDMLAESICPLGPLLDITHGT